MGLDSSMVFAGCVFAGDSTFSMPGTGYWEFDVSSEMIALASGGADTFAFIVGSDEPKIGSTDGEVIKAILKSEK